MHPLPNGAGPQLAEAIRALGKPGFGAALAGLFGCLAAPDNLLVLAFRDTGPPQLLFRQSRRPQVFARLERDYLAGAYLLDPYHRLHLAREPAGLYRLRDVAPEGFRRSRYFTGYYRQTTLIDELTYLAHPATGLSLNLCLGRDAASGRAFSAREVEVCRRLVPVVTALAEVHWQGLAAGPQAAVDVAGQLTAALARQGVALTPRQAEVALLILQGHSTGAIGLRLGVSPQTVKVFRRQLYARCGIASQAELFALMLPFLRGG